MRTDVVQPELGTDRPAPGDLGGSAAESQIDAAARRTGANRALRRWNASGPPGAGRPFVCVAGGAWALAARGRLLLSASSCVSAIVAMMGVGWRGIAP